MVTRGGGHVADQDDDYEDQEQTMGDVQELIAVGRSQRNSRKPSWLTTNMIVAYAPPVVEEVIPSIYIGSQNQSRV